MGVHASDSSTATLSAFVADTRYERLPLETIVAAQRCLRDSLSCAIGGAMLEPGALVRGLFDELGGRPEAVLLPNGPRAPLLHAVCTNAYLANVLDFDDTLNGHPGAPIVQTALAMADWLRVDGRSLLEAIVVGYEVGTRVGDAIMPTRERWDQVYSNATFLALGAAAAAAKLLRLDAERVAVTLGLAGMNAVVPAIRKLGTREDHQIGWAKNNYGWAAAGAVYAALLAQRGFVGTRTILDGPRGFWIMAGSDRFAADQAVAGLGERYRIDKTAFKPYPCCRFLHSSIDGLLKLQRAEGFGIDEIESIDVEAYDHVQVYMQEEPGSGIDAQFSLPHALVVAALGVPPGFGWSAPGLLDDPRVQRLRKCVTFRPSDDFRGETRYGARLTVRAKGQTSTTVVPYPGGHPRNPLADADLADKNRSLVNPVLGEERGASITDALESIATLGDVRELTDILVTAERPAGLAVGHPRLVDTGVVAAT